MIHFFKLIRPLNLLIIVFTMIMTNYFLIGAELWSERVNKSIFHFVSSEFDFFLLIFSTVLISAAGYIINDYFDIKIDRINKPDKLIVGKHIKKRWAMLIHVVFNTLAVFIGFYLTFKYWNLYILSVFIFTTSILWLYSLSLKRRLLIGNIAISILAASVVLLVAWFQIPLLEKEYAGIRSGNPFSKASIENIKWMIYLFAFFAGFSTLIREIIKDLADMNGDAAVHCKTLPLVIGVKKTKYTILFLILLFVAFLASIVFYYLNVNFVVTYFITLVAIPLLASAIICYRSNSRKNYILAGNLVKLAMFTGVLFLFFLKDYAF